MSPEQQRIAIAEACGIVSKDQWGPLYRTQYGIVRDCPDYINDLNAMHEAEKMLTNLNSYLHFLHMITLDDPTNISNEPAWATAAQRAEAFLRTLNLWKQ